jgi:D-glycero-alpha-D-manno-heptose-7-phosphate kinase
VTILASAPTRIDLAGGTIDIWPLYLFHEQAQTLNVAISVRAHCTIERRDDTRIVLHARDTDASADVADWSELPDRGELRLLSRILQHFRPRGLTLTTRSESPVGAGIAGSSALNVAVCGAVARFMELEIAPEELLAIAMNVEAQTIDVPTGVQDYRPAMYGGVSAVELRVDGVKRVPLAVDAREIEGRIVLAYTGASRNSGINNWEVTKRHIDGDRRVYEQFSRIRDVAVRMRAALEAGDWSTVAHELAAEWDNRKRLAPGVTTPEIDALMAAASVAGSQAAKVCGAGGGGCLFCICDPANREAVQHALIGAGARVLQYQVDSRGLVVESS